MNLEVWIVAEVVELVVVIWVGLGLGLMLRLRFGLVL